MKNALDIGGYSFPFRPYIKKHGGPNFNNIPISFDWTDALGTVDYRKWYAATANNSVYEFQAYAAANGLPNPPGNLIILLTHLGDGNNSGTAPMLDKGLSLNTLVLSYVAAAAATAGATTASHALAIATHGWVTAPSAPYITPPLATWLLITAPDIVVNISDSDNNNADDVREELYHELAHTIHFVQAGENYWGDNINFIIDNVIAGDNPPYGTDSLSVGGGRCNVIEMWGLQNGYWACHLRYGLKHSNGGNDPTKTTWQAFMEKRKTKYLYLTYGWQYDLRDINSVDIEEASDVNDKVSGYTQAQIFSTMNQNLLSGNQQAGVLKMILPVGNTSERFDTLAANYGLQ